MWRSNESLELLLTRSDSNVTSTRIVKVGLSNQVKLGAWIGPIGGAAWTSDGDALAIVPCHKRRGRYSIEALSPSGQATQNLDRLPGVLTTLIAPAVRAWKVGARPKRTVRDVDVTLTTAHSEKEEAHGNSKGGHGVCCLDGSGEALAGVLRPRSAGASTAADHIVVLEQLDRRALDSEILVRADGADATHELTVYRREAGCASRSGSISQSRCARLSSRWSPPGSGRSAPTGQGASTPMCARSPTALVKQPVAQPLEPPRAGVVVKAQLPGDRAPVRRCLPTVQSPGQSHAAHLNKLNHS